MFHAVDLRKQDYFEYSDVYPAIPPNWGETSAIKPSQAQEIVFKGLKPGKPVYIAPYALAGYESANYLNSAVYLSQMVSQ